MSSSEIINHIKSLSPSERLKIAEEILRSIREEGAVSEQQSEKEPAIFLAGVIDDEEAKVLSGAVEEVRTIH